MVSAKLVRAVNEDEISLETFSKVRKELTMVSNEIEKALSQGGKEIDYHNNFKVEYPHVWDIAHYELIRLGYDIKCLGNGLNTVKICW